MKRYTLVILLSVTLFGCKPTNIDPTTNSSNLNERAPLEESPKTFKPLQDEANATLLKKWVYSVCLAMAKKSGFSAEQYGLISEQHFAKYTHITYGMQSPLVYAEKFFEKTLATTLPSKDTDKPNVKLAWYAPDGSKNIVYIALKWTKASQVQSLKAKLFFIGIGYRSLGGYDHYFQGSDEISRQLDGKNFKTFQVRENQLIN